MSRRKRARAPGSIVELAPNQKYLVRVFMGWVEGPKPGRRVRKYASKTVIGSRADAENVLADFLRLKRERNFDPASLDLTVGAFIRRWIEDVSARDVRESTQERQAYMLEKDVIPFLGKLKLAALTTAKLDRFVAHLERDRKLSPASIRYCMVTVSKALQKAVAWDLIKANPARNVSLPQIRREEVSVFEPAELIHFMIGALHARKGAVLLCLLATTGLRPSEAFALRWGDIDSTRPSLKVQRTLVRFRGGYRFDKPKTRRGERQITLSPTIARLLEHEREARGDRAGDLVFPNASGEPLHPSTVYHRLFKPILRSVEAIDESKRSELKPYSLRHTHATHLLLQNVHPKVVSERLGHASVQLTLDTYSHVLPSMQTEVAAVVEGMLFGQEQRLPSLSLDREEELAPLKRQLEEAVDRFIKGGNARQQGAASD